MMYIHALSGFFVKINRDHKKYQNNPKLINDLYWFFWYGLMGKADNF